MAGLNSTDRTGRTKYVFLHKRRPLHRTHPAGDTEFPFQSGFVKFDGFESFGVLRADWCNARRKTIDRDNAFRRGDCGQRLNQAPGRVRNNCTPL